MKQHVQQWAHSFTVVACLLWAAIAGLGTAAQPAAAQGGSEAHGIAGCWLAAGASEDGIGPAIRLQPFNDSCARLLAEEQLYNQRLGVHSRIYLCSAENAFASHSGRVYLGQPLINDYIEKEGALYAFHAGAYIVANEFGHQFQYRIARERGQGFSTGPTAELQADVLAGLWAGQRLREQSPWLTMIGQGRQIDEIQSIVLDVAHAIGDMAFSSPDHHGTPEQRYQAVQVGLTAGYARKFGNPDRAFIERGGEVFDWSRHTAEVIYGRP